MFNDKHGNTERLSVLILVFISTSIHLLNGLYQKSTSNFALVDILSKINTWDLLSYICWHQFKKIYTLELLECCSYTRKGFLSNRSLRIKQYFDHIIISLIAKKK